MLWYTNLLALNSKPIDLEKLIGTLETTTEELARQHWYYQPAQEDEPNTIGFEMTKEPSKQENADAVLDLINKN